MHGVPRSRCDGKYVERVTAHAKTEFGRLEYQIGEKFGIDLFEVKSWPITKKLAYQQHMAVDVAIQQAARNSDGEFNPEEFGTDMNMPDVPNVPSSAKSNIPSMGGNSSGGVGRQASTESTKHPALAGYDSLVNVRNEDSDG